MLFTFYNEAQELLFANISNEMQLPSQECYKIHQDKLGYIWFSTDNGLCRYGNGSLKVFDKHNGLPEASVYNISEDPSGRLWFATSNNRILYLDNEKLIEAPFNNEYNKPAVKKWARPVPLFLDMSDPGNYFIANMYYSFRIDNNHKSTTVIPDTDSLTSVQFHKIQGHALVPNQFKKTNNKYFTIQLIKGMVNKRIVLFDLPIDNVIHWNTPTAFTGNADFIGIQNKLLKVNPDLSYTSLNFPGRILNLYIDKSKGLWVCVQNNGVYYFPDVTSMKYAHHSLAKFSVTGICEDKEGGIWSTTLEKGIFYSRNKHLVSYTAVPGLDRNMTLLKFTAGNLFASSSAKNLFQWAKQQYIVHSFPFGEERFSDILPYKDHWLLTGKEIMIFTNKQFTSNEKLLQYPYHNVGCNELAAGSNGVIYGILGKNFMRTNSSNAVSLVHYSSIYLANTMIHKSGDLFLMGGDQGLYEFNVITHQSRKIEGVPNKIKKIVKSHSGRIWIATKNNGIYWLDGDKVTNAAQELHFETNVLYDLTEDENGNFWAGSNRGLYCFSIKDRYYQTSLYASSHGLPSNEVYKVAAGKDKIWFSTFEGLFNLPLKTNIINSTGPAIHLQKLSVKNVAISHPPHTCQFPYNQNDFRFTFDVLTFKNGTNTKLEYHLKNSEQTLVTKLDGNELFLENLDPGIYHLTVYGINNDGVKSPQPEVFQITIGSPYWKTWWFISIVFILLVLLILVVIRYIVRRIQKKEEAKTEVNRLMAEYQITALQAQMNPHFIFNAINTIQGYILEKNEEEAYNYLSKFGKLIRKVLHHSQQKLLMLDQELEVLNLYIELEQLRFDNCFDYELKISENVISEDIYLPGMILQPYVENAIWHGIVNLNGSRRGKLNITMERELDVLIVTIADNGIGRKIASGFNKDRRHKSVGMQLTKQRLDAMNRFRGYEMAHVTITDIFNEYEQPAGTSVEVRIPINTEL